MGKREEGTDPRDLEAPLLGFKPVRRLSREQLFQSYRI